MFFEEKKKRKPIRMSVKKEVYQRTKGKCERCGIKMTLKRGNFHHTRSPTISPTAKTVQFLCPNCHSWYGHKRKTRTSQDFFGDRKVVTVKRQKVRKAPTRKTSKSKSKKPKAKTSTKKKTPTRSRTKSGRFRKKRSDAGKKRK